MEAFEQQIDVLTLVPSRGGVYEVTVDDELLHSKRETGRHVEADAIIERLQSR